MEKQLHGFAQARVDHILKSLAERLFVLHLSLFSHELECQRMLS